MLLACSHICDCTRGVVLDYITQLIPAEENFSFHPIVNVFVSYINLRRLKCVILCLTDEDFFT